LTLVSEEMKHATIDSKKVDIHVDVYVIATYSVTGVTNYAVEVTMRTPATSSQWWEFGVTACGLTQGSWTKPSQMSLGSSGQDLLE